VIKDLGIYVYNDDDSDLILELRDGFGNRYDFTGATAIVLVCQKVGSHGGEVAIAGAVYSATIDGSALGRIRFTRIAQALDDPGQLVVPWLARPRWLNSGSTLPSYGHTAYSFSLERFPRP
jgi:hypothetical protein